MIEEGLVKASKPNYGFSWALRNKGKVFRFEKAGESFYARIIGFAEDLLQGFFVVTSDEEPEGRQFMTPTKNVIPVEITDETILKRVPKPKDDKFQFFFAGPEHNTHFYGKMVMTPEGRKEMR